MKTSLLALPGEENLARSLSEACGGNWWPVEVRRLPDGESYVRLPDKAEVRDRSVALVGSLYPPNDRALALLFAAAAARDLGARRVGAVCPYLAYLRQNRRKHPGEALTANAFAQLLGASVDWLTVVDPHLRDPNEMASLYSIPVHPVWTSAAVARWIQANVTSPLLVGPDAGSRAQLERLAAECALPFTLLEKVRKDERKVELSAEGVTVPAGATAVVVDDILSTGGTMAAACTALKRRGASRIVAVATHGLFVEDAQNKLRDAGATAIATCNTVPHPTNAIDITPWLVSAVKNGLG